MLQTAKVFTTGRSQAVRLPLEFRFNVPEVFIRHDAVTGDVVLSRKPNNWQGLLDAVTLNAMDDGLLERPPGFEPRDPFDHDALSDALGDVRDDALDRVGL